MSCNNIYFDICLRKTMNYFSLSVCKFISGLLFSSRVERWKKFVSAGAKEEGNNIISCPFTALCMRCASHTRPARKRFVPFTLLASLRRNFTVFLRLRCWLLSLSYLVRCGSKCCGMRNLKLEPSVDLINLMIEFNRKMIHRGIISCIQWERSHHAGNHRLLQHFSRFFFRRIRSIKKFSFTAS